MNAFYNYRITSLEPQNVHFGLAERKWKKRDYDHKKSFDHKLMMIDG